MAKSKVQITIDEDLLKEVDEYCDRNYMNRSWLISQALVQVINQQKIINAIGDLSVALKLAAEQGTLDDDTQKQMEAFEALCKMYLGH